MNRAIRKRIKKRKAIYRDEGRSERRKKFRNTILEMIQKRQDAYHEQQRIFILDPDTSRHFFRNIKSLSCVEKPKQFDVCSLLPGLDDKATSEELATYFNAISQEFSPLEPKDIPRTWDKPLPVLEVHEIATRIKKSLGNLAPWSAATSSPNS